MNERGFTVVEVLLAATLMVVVLMATLTMLDAFGGMQKRTAAVSDSVDRTRTAMDRLTRDLRDATPQGATSAPGGTALLRATPTDLVMRRVNPFGTSSAANPYAVYGVRWCLDTERGELHRQHSTTGGLPVAACPDASWSDRVVANDVVNGPRAVFTYNASSLEDITSVATFLAIDGNPAREPGEGTLSSGVHLRNQNRRPSANFTAVALPGRNVQLNGTTSIDPEGGMLTYEWRDGSTVLPTTAPTTTYTAPAAGARPITLRVTDANGLSSTTTQTVAVLP